jgi:hypothetical protein
MSPKKYYFDEPLVRVSLSRVQFPKICPVCGAPSTATTRIVVTIRKNQHLRRSWDYYEIPFLHVPHEKGGQGIITPNSNVLQINVCEKHYYSDESEERYKILCLIIDGLAMAFMSFGLLFLGDSISRARAVSPWVAIFTAIFATSMIMTAIAFRPNVLARAVKIIGFDAGMQNVLLAFKSNSYRDEFIKANSMHSELVRWILKADG